MSVSQTVLMLVTSSILFGCQTKLAPTPYVSLRENSRAVFDELPLDQRKPEMEIFYATDRAAEETDTKDADYGFGRSRALTFGVATVDLEPKLSWDELVKLCTSQKRDHDYVFKMVSVRKLGRVDPLFEHVTVENGEIVLPPEGAEAFERQKKAMRDILAERLRNTPRKEVFIFVHGFANSFADATFRLAQLWNYMGRVGVPIVYTWPAGSGGLFGYFQDRESGEFTIYHLKEFLREVARCPEVERVHLIAHSRGTDVLTTALRELNLEDRARGLKAQKELKLETLVLAAPDLDADVFSQRFGSERLVNIARRIAIYHSVNDSAIGLALWLFGSSKRVGGMSLSDLPPESRKILAQLPSLQTIDCTVSGFATSHAYVFDDPAAMSDLILLLRDRCDPGAQNGRPLRADAPGWILDNDFLKPRDAD